LVPGATLAPLGIALLGRCPRCGQGKLFEGLLGIRERCAVCELDLRAVDTGDGPASLVVLVLGAILAGLVVWVDARFTPPLWVHAVIWPVVAVPAAILMIRVLKAGLVWSQYRNRASEMGLH
jgi:uncharacterized protein (DUF983 family)